MSWTVVRAVYESRLETKLRFLAVTLAWHAHDDGREIRPGIERLARALGIHARAVKYGLRELRDRQLLVRDGRSGSVRRYRLDLERLATYTPAEASSTDPRVRRKAEPGPTVPDSQEAARECSTLHSRDDAGECSTLHSEGAAGVQYGVRESAVPRPRECSTVHARVQYGAPELYELEEAQELEDLPARSAIVQPGDPRVLVPTSKNLQPHASRAVDFHPDKNSEDEPPPAAGPVDDPPVAIYAALARLAIADATAERDDSVPTILRHFDRRCRARGLADYGNHVSAGEGLSEAFVSRERAQHEFLATLHRVAGRRPSTLHRIAGRRQS
jgi:hypothetical protein